MEPEAQLIAAQAAEELARQQATGQVDEIQRGRMAQQILGGAAQQAKAREAQQAQAEFARRKRLGDVVAAGEAENRLREYRKKTQDIGGMFQAGLGAASALAAQYGSYLAEQSALAEGLKAAEAKGGVQGAIDFLNENPNYDPGQETLQRLYAGSEMGQQDAAKRAMEQDALARSVFNAASARRFERQFDPGTVAMSNVPGAMSDFQQTPEDISMSTSPFQRATTAFRSSPELFLSQARREGKARQALLDEQLRQRELLYGINQQLNALPSSEPTLEDRLRLLQALGL